VFVEPRRSIMRVFRFLVSILAALVLLAVLAPPAQAAVPRIPLTCGMVLTSSADVYLNSDLYCPGFGVRVAQDHSDDFPAPHVRVDLRGHELRGSGTSYGVTEVSSGGDAVTYIEVVNGRLRNWGAAVSGGWSIHIRNVTLVDNHVGFGCGGLDCIADQTRFQRNSEGFHLSADAGATITRSMFVDNAVGASTGGIWMLHIDHSVFLRNHVGVTTTNGIVRVAESVFVKNRTAIQVVREPIDVIACASLKKVVFAANAVDLEGPRCSF
jgi:hypothetical protein